MRTRGQGRGALSTAGRGLNEKDRVGVRVGSERGKDSKTEMVRERRDRVKKKENYRNRKSQKETEIVRFVHTA